MCNPGNSSKRRSKRVTTNRAIYKYKKGDIQRDFEKFLNDFNRGVRNEY
jgi:hypothetical protein